VNSGVGCALRQKVKHGSTSERSTAVSGIIGAQAAWESRLPASDPAPIRGLKRAASEPEKVLLKTLIVVVGVTKYPDDEYDNDSA
jgi:hypothetical protein